MTKTKKTVHPSRQKKYDRILAYLREAEIYLRVDPQNYDVDFAFQHYEQLIILRTYLRDAIRLKYDFRLAIKNRINKVLEQFWDRILEVRKVIGDKIAAGEKVSGRGDENDNPECCEDDDE